WGHSLILCGSLSGGIEFPVRDDLSRNRRAKGALRRLDSLEFSIAEVRAHRRLLSSRNAPRAVVTAADNLDLTTTIGPPVGCLPVAGAVHGGALAPRCQSAARWDAAPLDLRRGSPPVHSPSTGTAFTTPTVTPPNA